MAHSEFQARALYDFVAEGPNELSFHANDILSITSNAAGQGWWYARSAFGKVGVIPENYVQALADPPEPKEPPPPLLTYTNTNHSNYPTLDSPNNNSNNSRSSYQSNADQHQYMNPTTFNSWQPPEPPAWTPPQRSTSHQSAKRDTDSDSFSDSDYPTSTNQPANFNTLPSNATISNHGRPSLLGTEASKAPPLPRARFFDKHGLDNYLLNGCKAKPDGLVEITFDDREGGVFWSPNPNIPPFSCRVEEPSKGTKLGGLKAFMEYKIHPQIAGSRVVGRRYKQFDWLHEQLVNKFRFICIPPLPGKQIAGRFDQVFVEERRRLLELWLNRVCRHPVLCASFPVQHFIACELTEKNKKDWKTGKRTIEKDELREAPWLQCVTLIKTGLTDQQIQSQIDTFSSQQPGLESQLKTLSQGITKYMERHTEVYERDIQRISELFSKVHVAVQVDATTPGNKDLSNSIMKISGSYGGIAELYKTKASEGLRDFNERLQEYMGLLGCFPSILSIQRSATEFMRTVHQRAPSTNTDFSSAIHRNHVLNHVVLAEINFFQQEKVTDLNVYMKTLIDDQIQFYEKVTVELRDASFTFK